MRGGRALRRPAQRSTSSCPRERAWRRSRREKDARRHPSARWAEIGAQIDRRSATRVATRSAPRVRAGRAEHADDRRRRRRRRRARSCDAAPRSTAATGCSASTTRAFSPIPDASSALPLQARAADARAPAVPGRLAAALLRLRAPTRSSAAAPDGMLALDIDPKLAWALRAPRALPGRREPRAARGAAARARPRASSRSRSCCACGGCSACASRTWRRSCPRSRRSSPSSWRSTGGRAWPPRARRARVVAHRATALAL